MAAVIGNRLKAQTFSRQGFSLLELLVALAVLGVATTIFIRLYSLSTDFARVARNRTVAAAIAEEQLARLRMNPDQFQWQIPEPVSSEVFGILVPEEPPAGNEAAPGKAMPPELKAKEDTETLYQSFRWKAFGRIPEPNAAFVEVTVAVYWTQSGRPESLALSTALMRRAVPVPAGGQG
ncbi:MAG: prepilin-type N-terminal cleavage/methylation domain-containing protein [Candidatus Hydrogenedentes bacterium]|nr:prepilin-type N-terminal cleavage/methylation domain-containing protein [Candidatus Hydrogenedentota bacterium]